MIGPPRWIERYLAIPFLDKGRDAKGCDCFGLVRLVLAERAALILATYGFVSADDTDAIANEITIAAAHRDTWRSYPLASARTFDVVVMVDSKGPRHVGVMVNALHVLHSERESGPSCVPVKSVVHRVHPQSFPVVYRHRSLW